MAIDTHAHINSLVLNDIEKRIKEINESNILEKVINVSLDLKTFKECLEIAKNNPKIYATIGIHPLYINDDNLDQIYNLVNESVVAIGEIGLDSSKNNFEDQRTSLIKQIMIANDLHLPVIFPCYSSCKRNIYTIIY